MPELGESLSKRELDVLNCVAQGDANKQIALTLHISPNTVKVHLRNIYTKLGVGSRTEATRVAFEQRLVKMNGIDEGQEEKVEILPTPPQEDQQAIEPQQIFEAEPVSKAVPLPKNRWFNWRYATFTLIFLLIVITTGLIYSTSAKPTPTPTPIPFTATDLGDNWQTGRDLPVPTTNMALTAVGLQLYQIGGETADGVVDTVYIYDTVDFSWSIATAKPTAVTNSAAAVLFGEIYIPGGRTADGEPTDIFEVYSPANDAWRTAATLPRPIAEAVVVSDGNLLYLISGWDGADYLDTIFVYDTVADSWRPLSNQTMSQPRASAAGDIIDRQLYLVGGHNQDGALSICERFDLIEETWHSCSDTLHPRTGASAVVLVNRLYLFGGLESNDAGQTISEFFDPVTEEWLIVNTPMKTDAQSNWSNMGTALVETKIHALGGQQGDTLLPNNFVFAPLTFRTYLPAATGGQNN